MKRILLIIGIILYLMPTYAYSINPEKNPTNSEKLTIIFSRDVFDSPESLEKYINKNFVYIEEEEGYTKTIIELIQDGGGDCEDLAIFTYRVLDDMGYTPSLLLVWTENTGHAITVFRESSGKLSFFSNLEYIKTEFTDILFLRVAYFPKLEKYVSCDLNGHSICDVFLKQGIKNPVVNSIIEPVIKVEK